MDQFGSISGCVSPEDHAAAQEFLMTSVEASSDLRTLLGIGCGATGAGGFVDGLIAYARPASTRQPAPPILDFWRFLASH